jgi:hypothetical protein
VNGGAPVAHHEQELALGEELEPIL